MSLRKLPPRPAGLGDVVEIAAKVTGVKAVVEKVSEVTGKDCGCKKRQKALNQMVPFTKDKS